MPKTRTVSLAQGKVIIGGGSPICFVLGPCVIESEDQALEIAEALKELSFGQNIPIIFKASFDKANRTSVDSFRGVGLDEGINILRTIKEKFDLPILSDVHEPAQVEKCAPFLDVIQIPAFLCRQTDLLAAAGDSGRAVNIKKGQFLAPEDMAFVIEKIEKRGNRQILLTERGTSFGYHNLVVDFRSLSVMKRFGCPVIFDATHSVQLPGGGKTSGGESSFVRPLARAAAAVGTDGFFMEVFRDGTTPLCDAANSIRLSALPAILGELCQISDLISEMDSDDI